MPYVNVKGNNIYYEAAGAGFPIVLLHPWPTDHAMWMLQVPIFSADYRVITPDSIGLGQSAKPRSGITLKGLADDVNALLDELGEKKAFIVGLSL
ncbi:MAG: alpha/beta fold hydrolase, partial [Burkholderiaceae bacterium]